VHSSRDRELSYTWLGAQLWQILSFHRELPCSGPNQQITWEPRRNWHANNLKWCNFLRIFFNLSTLWLGKELVTLFLVRIVLICLDLRHLTHDMWSYDLMSGDWRVHHTLQCPMNQVKFYTDTWRSDR